MSGGQAWRWWQGWVERGEMDLKIHLVQDFKECEDIFMHIKFFTEASGLLFMHSGEQKSCRASGRRENREINDMIGNGKRNYKVRAWWAFKSNVFLRDDSHARYQHKSNKFSCFRCHRLCFPFAAFAGVTRMCFAEYHATYVTFRI